MWNPIRMLRRKDVISYHSLLPSHSFWGPSTQSVELSRCAGRAGHRKAIINTLTVNLDERRDRLIVWLAAQPDVAGLPLLPASADASFRRYFRLKRGTRSWIVMDAPPPAEDCRPFIKVAGLLARMSLNVPVILAADVEQGFVLMSDLGSRQYLQVLDEEPAAAPQLYADAVQALVTLQRRGADYRDELPPYDTELLSSELALFRDWLCARHLGIGFSADEARQWQAVCEQLIDSALAQPRVFVHRDFHSRNLMHCASRNPGILDFQDAVCGPLTYDLVSLVKDCYFRLPDGLADELIEQFYAGLDARMRPVMSLAAMQQSLALMGVQRHLKAAGIFARLLHRDGKDGYMQDVPRTLRYILEAVAAIPELGFLEALIGERVLPALEERR